MSFMVSEEVTVKEVNKFHSKKGGEYELYG